MMNINDNISINTIDDHFKEFIFGFMLSDLKVAIEQGLNFLAALSLMSYTEILGGYVTGKLKTRGNSGRNFKAFLPYLGDYYVDLDDRIGIYERVRCGLTHEYFIKGNASVVTKSNFSRGIFYNEDDDKIYFIAQNYYKDLKKAIEKYHNEIINEENQELIRKFYEALNG